MKRNTQSPENGKVVEDLRPLFAIFSDVHQTAMERVRRGAFGLGIPRPVERANDMHRAIRECLNPICDLCSDWFELVQEPEGVGMDYIAVTNNWTDTPFLLRWGRSKDGRISRNGTKRSTACRAIGYLFDGFDEEYNDLPLFTLAHTVEGDFTKAGIPQWWIGRLFLVRERLEASEEIYEIARFEEPKQHQPSEYEKPLVRIRELDEKRWGDMVNSLRRSA